MAKINMYVFLCTSLSPFCCCRPVPYDGVGRVKKAGGLKMRMFDDIYTIFPF